MHLGMKITDHRTSSGGGPSLPTVTGAEISSTGLVIVITFSTVVTGGGSGGFYVVDAHGDDIITTYNIGDGSTVMEFTLDRVAYQGEPVTLRYEPGNIEGAGGFLAEFTGQVVTNNSNEPTILTYDGETSTTFNQVGLASTTYKCWGAGGDGGAGTLTGGGGGGYSEATSTFSGEASIESSGGACSVTVDSVVIAAATPGDDGDAGGAGGASTAGTTVGNGGSGGIDIGGGGGSGGDTTDGGNGGDGDRSSIAGEGGAAGTTNGAKGGAGAIFDSGENGTAPGGGGGVSVFGDQGQGADSRIEITWTY